MSLLFPLHPHNTELLLSQRYVKQVKLRAPSNQVPSLPPCTHHLEPTNYVSIIRGFQPIHESITIDPSLDIPVHLRPPLTQTERTEQCRNNLNLKACNATIVGDIHLSETSTKSSDFTPKLDLSIRAGRGDVFLSIPRNYYGPLRINSKGIVSISPSLAGASLRTTKETSCGMLFMIREYFVGRTESVRKEPSLSWLVEEEEEEEGSLEVKQMPVEVQCSDTRDDEITIEAKGGRVYLQYDDETL
ncbi:hypothetical protein BDP27DRAFT_1337537 [Rhodocollybia butyracea]|uniref:DUF7330 domain-containing protein n=1 Tax=Rhodocollybia butyracea TaxID=206335 RepID=A0A9P5U1P1_9AGAR|nr:hypothetical protein BDP27DRAFT_1337537 [Rhodocollybia butyracea]